MTTPATDRRHPLYDGSPKFCSLCNRHKRRTADNWARYTGKGATTDGLGVYCLRCYVTLVAVRRRKQLITAAGGRANLEKLRRDHLRSLAMFNVLLSGRADHARNTDIVRITMAEIDRLMALPIILAPERKGGDR